jgi:hypothetical protein
MALLGQPGLQVPDLRCHHLHLLAQPWQLAHLGPQHGVFGFPLGDALVWRHATMLRLQRKSA